MDLLIFPELERPGGCRSALAGRACGLASRFILSYFVPRMVKLLNDVDHQMVGKSEEVAGGKRNR